MALHVWTDGEEFVIAESAEDALQVMREIGCDPPNDMNFRQLPDNVNFTSFEDDTFVSPTTKTCAEWAAHIGRGYFCCYV